MGEIGFPLLIGLFGSLHLSPRCSARTRQARRCQSPAVKGKRVCRMHGGGKGSGALQGAANGAWKHVGSNEAVSLRRAAARLLRVLRTK